MALLNRETLKSFFSKGSSPSEEHFAELINSSVNKIDDGFAKSIEEGLQLAPQGKSDRVMSLYYDNVDENPDWQISLPNKDGEKGLKIQNSENEIALFVDKRARIGIQTTQPNHALEINGFLGTKGRVGTFFKGKVPGDGKWRNILVNLDRPQIYEVVARIDGPPASGKYAIAHAIAACTYGRGRNKIRMTQAHYSWFFDRLQMRWKGENKKFNLQIRTRGHYGEDANEKFFYIKFHISQLWDENQEFDEVDETLAQHEAQ
jgi:hypothetical protein